jgi:hypothetical protein
MAVHQSLSLTRLIAVAVRICWRAFWPARCNVIAAGHSAGWLARVFPRYRPRNVLAAEFFSFLPLASRAQRQRPGNPKSPSTYCSIRTKASRAGEAARWPRFGNKTANCSRVPGRTVQFYTLRPLCSGHSLANNAGFRSVFPTISGNRRGPQPGRTNVVSTALWLGCSNAQKPLENQVLTPFTLFP